MTLREAPPPMLSPPPKGFRPSFRIVSSPVFWVAPLVEGPFLATATALLGFPFSWGSVAACTGILFAITLTVALLWMCCRVVHVSIDGIRARDVWGFSSLVRWDEITGAGRSPWLWRHLLRVRSVRGGYVQFPWPLADHDGFRKAVREHGGPDSPLAQWLDAAGR